MEVHVRSNLAAFMWPEWAMIERLRGGTAVMRAAGEAYLPRWPAEEPDAYRARIGSSFLFNAFEHTVESLTGAPFSEPLKLNDDIPDVIRANLDDADMEGRDLHNFARETFLAGLSYGHAFILVDYPTTTGAKTQADLKIAGARPFLQLIHPQQVLYWHASLVKGVMTADEVRIWELQDDQAGMFSEIPIMRVRVLKPDSFEVWEAQVVSGNKPATWALVEEGPNTLGRIPLVPFYAKRTGFYTSRPPLLDLAYLNVEHWQSASDQRHILHTARVPILGMFTDDETEGLTIGASSAVKLTKGSDMRWVETQGHAIAAGRQDLLDLEDRMRQIGASLIEVNTARMTATGEVAQESREQSKLGAIAQGLEDALNTALYLWAQWIGLDSGGTVEIFRDFGIDGTTATDQQTLLAAAGAHLISNQTFFEEMQRRGTLTNDVDWTAEQERIAQEGPALGTLHTSSPEAGPHVPASQ